VCDDHSGLSFPVLLGAGGSFVLWRISALCRRRAKPCRWRSDASSFSALRATLCLIRAFAAAPANIVAPFGYTAVLWATLFSLMIFGEIPGPRSLFGEALIVGAGLFIFLGGRKI
jgi:drug/metabolite transporter (DMT)-like permease